MDHLSQLLLAWSIQWAGIVSPGPSVMLILGVAAGKGRSDALATAFGIACGSILLASATVLGVAALFAQMAYAMTAVRFIGAAYLLWLSLKAFRKAASAATFEIVASKPGGAWKAGLRGFMLQTANPKAILFWLAIAAMGGADGLSTPMVGLLVAGAFVNSFLGHGLYALLLSSRPVRALYVRFRAWTEGALGCLFLVAGCKLARG